MTSKAKDRYQEGQAAALNLINKLEKGEIKLDENETIKIVGHSQGGAFAAGMANVLAKHEKYSSKLAAVYYLNPHQPKDFKHPEGVKGVQFSTENDRVASIWNFLSWLKGETEYGSIKNITRFVARGSADDVTCGHFVDSNLDQLVEYYRDFGIKVTVYD